MPQIGEFIRTKSGYSGHIRTLWLDVEVKVAPVESSDAENAPDYRIHLRDEDGPEIGAGWKRTGERAGDYVSLQLDDPVFMQPVRANLFQSSDDKTVWALHWNRPQKRAKRD